MAQELRGVEPLRPLLENGPLALFSDIDGTLAPIVPDPSDAAVTPRTREALGRLVAAGVKVAFVTGRTLEAATRILGIEGAWVAANHGLDLLIDGREETPAEVRPYIGWARDVLREMGQIDAPGVFVEDKGAILAFHYRRSDGPDDAQSAIRAAIARSDAARHFRVQEGRKVYELRPPLAIDKGTAVDSMARRMGARSVMVMGDDATDVDMFAAVSRMRLTGMRGVCVAVWSDEVAPLLMERADYLVRGVAGVEVLLEGIGAAIANAERA